MSMTTHWSDGAELLRFDLTRYGVTGASFSFVIHRAPEIARDRAWRENKRAATVLGVDVLAACLQSGSPKLKRFAEDHKEIAAAEAET